MDPSLFGFLNPDIPQVDRLAGLDRELLATSPAAVIAESGHVVEFDRSRRGSMPETSRDPNHQRHNPPGN